MTTSATASRGGTWLLEAAARIFTPEQMSDEHRLIARTTEEFARFRSACRPSTRSSRRTGRWLARS